MHRNNVLIFSLLIFFFGIVYLLQGPHMIASAQKVQPTSAPTPTPTPRLAIPTQIPTATPILSPSPTPTPSPSPTPTPTGTPIELGAWYAANGPGSDEDTAAQILDGANFTAVRTRIIWSAPTGQWAWSDGEIDYQVAAGRNVILEFWAQFAGAHPSGGDCSTGTLADYSTLVQGIANRYGNVLYAIHPENEVDRCNNAIDAADRLEIVYNIFHNTAPNVKVLAPSLAYDYFMVGDAPPGYYPLGGPFRYSTLGQMLARLNTKACKPCTHAFTFHRFSGFPYWPTVIAKAANIRNRLAPYGWNNLPLWLTEFGSPAGPYPATEMTQATQALLMAQSARDEGNIPVAILYSALDQAGQLLGATHLVGGVVTPRIVVPTLGAMPR